MRLFGWWARQSTQEQPPITIIAGKHYFAEYRPESEEPWTIYRIKEAADPNCGSATCFDCATADDARTLIALFDACEDARLAAAEGKS